MNKKIYSLAFLLGAVTIGVAQNGRVGINTDNPTNTLHIKNTTANQTTHPIRIEDLKQRGANESTKLLVVDDNGVVKKSPIEERFVPASAVLALESNINNFLQGVGVGRNQKVEMRLLNNAIDGLTYNSSNGYVSFPSGVYTISFIYEADHNATGCKVSSYYVDFYPSSGLERIHTTSTHNEGVTSNHGGNITYTGVYTGSTNNFPIFLGRGISGDAGCIQSSGMVLKGGSTHVIITRQAPVN